MTSYTLRAELPADADELLAILKIMGCRFEGWQVSPAFEEWMPDVRVTFSCEESLDVLRSVIANISDGHVMYETIATTEDYAGERSYNMRSRGEA